jgi:replicative DNA helicase
MSETKEIKQDLGNNDPLVKIEEELNASQEKVIFLSEAINAAGIQITIKKLKKGELSVAIGVEDIAALQAALEQVKKKQPKYPFVLTFCDSDKKEQDLKEKIKEILNKQEIKYIEYPFELMRKKELKEAIPHLISMAKDDMGVIEKSLNDINASKQMGSFLEVISNCANAPAIKTGFDRFDEALGGGLRAGRLYGIGAITSLGKTTFALQIADNIARSKQDVLIFSLEMSRYELMGKSISRGTYELCKDRYNATPLQDILDYSKVKQQLSKEKVDILDNATGKYRDEIAPCINISEGVGDIGVEQIRELVERFYIFKSKRPVIIVDYLQILAPFNERLTDKQNIDKNVLELKRICRDFQVPVIIINSFNRANYLNEASFEAFKESGAIEYSCDVLIALQLSIKKRDGWTEKTSLCEKRKEVNNAKIKSPRDVEAIILKNRGYKAYVRTFFEYLPEYDYFEDVDGKNSNGNEPKEVKKIKNQTDIQYDDEE